ncbi:methyltransferase [Paraglaciecola hydrolytica]|uniref:Ribosomal RNA large subunit methyltransferase G n=1 Tax=Paraglaciecola hydrolytica TaxID=1799789 RepID=A0A136A4V3_9ALTE|nr:methyltransferase [Paraglaciecola hydrolytica]KXI30278.1 23S rRNA (guanine(1835)-N(2))-methyltransferase [Paraglaciecola hydrolytica]
MKASLTLFDQALQLVRYPEHLQHPSWQAWDAADEYIIEYLQERPELAKAKGLRIYNDDFGALSCWFANQKPTWISDSYVALRSCQDNLALNNIDSALVTFRTSLDKIISPTELVLIKIPKTTALLEQQLIDLQDSVGPQTLIIAAAKANAIQKSTLALFEKYLGITTTSLAKKKARLIFCQPTGKPKHKSPYPTHWFSESPKFELSNHANVFARQQLDIGARFMLQYLPKANGKTLIDLGCGNGVLGLSILYKYPESKVIFVDESYMAVASAQENVQRNLPEALPRCEFQVSNCLDEFLNQAEHQAVDLVLCNPPFHQQNAITDHIALQMFSDAKKALANGGELIVVGNRHLDYPVKLKRMFRAVKQTATNQKFSIFTATK